MACWSFSILPFKDKVLRTLIMGYNPFEEKCLYEYFLKKLQNSLTKDACMHCLFSITLSITLTKSKCTRFLFLIQILTLLNMYLSLYVECLLFLFTSVHVNRFVVVVKLYNEPARTRFKRITKCWWIRWEVTFWYQMHFAILGVGLDVIIYLTLELDW